ncbi:hypothetical protein [Nonomuraea sp. NPDC049028]|uniref:hypothetical protein n=1 Tax=Nonomuraea sp. NPDC049028 TaxID=3364348 RepID=UPI003713932D
MTWRAFAAVTERPISVANLVSRSDVTGMAAISTVTMATTQEIIGGTVTKCHHIWCYIVSSDDIWRQFGIATWRAQRSRLSAMAAGGLTLVIVAAALWGSGSITPRVQWSLEALFLRAEVDQNGVLSTPVYIELENEGMASFVLTGISAEIPGLRLLSADQAKGESSEVAVESGNRQIMERRIVITDCAAVPHEPQPIRFTYRTWLGPGSVEVMGDSWGLPGLKGSVPVAWQRGLAAEVCNDAVSPDWP